jgi:Spy/CpxP family protein refolding chaperone
MTSTLKTTLAAALALGAVTLGALTLSAPAASAMPMGFAPATPEAQFDAVRWVCGPYRCHWRPDYRRRHHRHHGWRHW